MVKERNRASPNVVQDPASRGACSDRTPSPTDAPDGPKRGASAGDARPGSGRCRDRDQRHLDVASGGVAVRADPVGSIGQLHGRGLVHIRDMHLQQHGQAERPSRDGPMVTFPVTVEPSTLTFSRRATTANAL